VRPLLDDGAGPSELTRDYALEMDRDGAPLLTVWGGKITTFRTLAEEAVGLLAPRLGCTRAGWTHDALLPGGDLSVGPGQARPGATVLEDFFVSLSDRYPWVPPAMLRRMALAYGSRVSTVLGSASRLRDLGGPIADGVYEAELEHLATREWATGAEDVLWRRSKLGLRLSPGEHQRVADWFEGRLRAHVVAHA